MIKCKNHAVARVYCSERSVNDIKCARWTRVTTRAPVLRKSPVHTSDCMYRLFWGLDLWYRPIRSPGTRLGRSYRPQRAAVGPVHF